MPTLLSVLPTLLKLLSSVALPLIAWLFGRSSGKKSVQMDDTKKAAKVEAAMAQAETTRPADKQAVVDALEKGTF